MKILSFTTLYPNNVWPNHGVFVRERMRHVHRRDGSQLRVVAPVPYFPPIRTGPRWKYSQVVREEIRDGVPIYHPRYFMTPKIGMITYGTLMFLSVLPLMRRLHRQFDFDVIDAHYVYPDGMAAVLCGAYFNRPVVVSARGSDINLFADLPLVRRALRYTLKRATRLIAVCDALKQQMIALGAEPGKITVVPNGVDAEKFRPMPRKDARRELQLSERRIVLSVGQLIPRKGFDLLLEAMSLLNKEAPAVDAELVIIGEGEQRSVLEQRSVELGLADRVRLVNGVSHDELHRWYNAADVFCLASSREGWPNVVLESLACGTPVVATAVWGLPEIITSDGLGTLVERDAAAIARALREALSRDWNQAIIRDYACSKTWDAAAEAVLKVLGSAIRGPGAAPA